MEEALNCQRAYIFHNSEENAAYEDNRPELAKSAYGQTVDPANSNLLYDLFTSQARKDALRDYINSYSYNR